MTVLRSPVALSARLGVCLCVSASLLRPLSAAPPVPSEGGNVDAKAMALLRSAATVVANNPTLLTGYGHSTRYLDENDQHAMATPETGALPLTVPGITNPGAEPLDVSFIDATSPLLDTLVPVAPPSVAPRPSRPLPAVMQLLRLPYVDPMYVVEAARRSGQLTELRYLGRMKFESTTYDVIRYKTTRQLRSDAKDAATPGEVIADGETVSAFIGADGLVHHQIVALDLLGQRVTIADYTLNYSRPASMTR